MFSFFTQSLPSTHVLSAISNIVPQFISPTSCNSTPAIADLASENALHDSQQLSQMPKPDDAAANLSAPSGISRTPEAYVCGRFKTGCKIAASHDSDEEWDFMDDFKPGSTSRKLSQKVLDSKDDKKISDAVVVKLPEVLDDLKPFRRKYRRIYDIVGEYEILDDLKPLPVEIALQTGDYEKVLFQDQAYLYKLEKKEWKEQGFGVIKIIYNTSNGRYRFVMGMEEVLKVCANHYITSKMKVLPSVVYKLAFTWEAEQFVNEELKLEHYCIRFKDPEAASAFKISFTRAVRASQNSSSIIAGPCLQPSSMKIDLQFASSWCCTNCKTENGRYKQFCFVCKEKKPCWCRTASGVGKYHTCGKFQSLFFTPKESWCCSLCETVNEADRRACVVCETGGPY